MWLNLGWLTSDFLANGLDEVETPTHGTCFHRKQPGFPRERGQRVPVDRAIRPLWLLVTHTPPFLPQFRRNWLILFDTDHNQVCLFISEPRQGQKPLPFNTLQSFPVLFTRQAAQLSPEQAALCESLPAFPLGHLSPCPLCATVCRLLSSSVESDNGYCFHIFIFPQPNNLRAY